MIKHTPRLVLRPPVKFDAPYFVMYLNDPETVKYSEQRHKQHSLESQLDYWHSAATAEPNFVDVITVKGKEKMPIGSVAVRVDQFNQFAEVGILIGKPYWGQGYGFEAWEAVCNYLFTAGGVRRIEAGCMAINDPMVKICEKFRMTRDALIPNHFKVDNYTAALLIYGKNR